MPHAIRNRRIVCTTTIAFVFAVLATAQPRVAIAQEKLMQRTITVAASASVSAPPDQARITAGVTTQSATARAALTGNTEAMNKVLAAIKGLGVAARDIQTSNLSVEPVINYQRDGAPPEVTGYRVSNQVSVVVRDLSRLGEAMDDIVSAGANQIHGLSFEASKADELKDEARAAAVANALRRAKLLAEAGGAKVGRVLEIVEGSVQAQPRMAGRMARMSAEAVPVETGMLDLEANVTVTWELN